MKRGVSYGRVSTGRQAEEGTSLGAQHEANRKRAEEMGVEIDADNYIEDDVSGELYLARPGVQKVLRMVEAKEVEYVFFYRLDRSGRDTEALLNIRKRFQRAGATVVYSSGQEFANNPSGNLAYTVFAGFAEYERQVIKERTTRGSLARVKEDGRQVAMRSPYGYHIVDSADVIRGTHTAQERGKYLLVPDVSEVAAWIFHRYADGMSLYQLARSLNKWCVPSPKGKEWTRQTLSVILSNPVYKGTATYGRRQNLVDERRTQTHKSVTYVVQREESEWLYLETPSVVSTDLWDAVQEIGRAHV